MKITSVKTKLISVPFKAPIRVSTLSLAKRDAIIVEVETDEGVTGMEYIPVLGRGSETIKACMDHDIADLLIGEDPLYRNKIWEKLWWALNMIGRKGIAMYGISAVDVALWDLAGKLQKTSIHKMLGPYTNQVKVYGSAGFMSLSEEELVEEAEGVVARGFKAFKMKAGFPDLRIDLKRVTAVRKALGPDIDIMVDVNQGLDVPAAIQFGRELEKLGIYWFEEPVPADDMIGHAEVARALDIRITTGETEYSRYGFRELIDRKAGDILMMNLRAGGITEVVRIANMASAHRISVTPHLAWELQNQIYAAITNGTYIEYMDWYDDWFEDVPQIKDGMATVWDRPGHGLKFREEIVRQYAVE
ncbi:L-alanine-DL-glutamate epimerase-like enolase superfamily enzyme [Paenibacillus taihuensis]|uniref:L-alanine-DL-glutamate epimerase-like enolase superfamily enzyme n=1 Tax=Paenibacillus taihuensis TaxID=1156355 RepID=A0A3D9S8T1_9BACL|nr:mandelate racemase/muconate lactonizing enzyme family protein [Paenibacillus taihuensis]REE85320.1 L-alanine-DL-glutamate epimerase-like enolase superfamily enzyme [Paenibacillus taihuensis]